MGAEQHFVYGTTEDERRYERTYLNLEEAHERAKSVLSASEIRLGQFAGLYGEDILRRDAAEVARLERKFEKVPSKLYADILEAIACEHGELSDWFGPKSQVIKTALFDDYVNKIDMIVETEEERNFSHLALGVDVTFGSHDLHKKFDGIRAKIDAGSLGEVKYFHSDRQHFTGRLMKLPLVVVGVEIERVKELGLLWMNRRNKDLQTHPVQVLILQEAMLQLKTFADYARRTGKPDVAIILEHELRKIQELLAAKKEHGITTIAGDKVFEEIKRNLASFTVK